LLLSAIKKIIGWFWKKTTPVFLRAIRAVVLGITLDVFLTQNRVVPNASINQRLLALGADVNLVSG
jgi:hypothetical protein